MKIINENYNVIKVIKVISDIFSVILLFSFRLVSNPCCWKPLAYAVSEDSVIRTNEIRYFILSRFVNVTVKISMNIFRSGFLLSLSFVKYFFENVLSSGKRPS
uniref:(northern house mosquito) hypothetical protein n=1 Tax=Culex pipiens TaxID=7175 RepID=A0A8D8IE66_CULPI